MNRDDRNRLEQRLRDIVRRRRAEAFDNVDIDRLLSETPIPLSRVAWFGRHLMQHGRTLEAYREGQELVAAAEGL